MSSAIKESTPIDTSSLVDKVYDYLLGRIIEGEMRYGDSLNIKKLAEELQVSAMPVREALKRLEYEKIVEIKPRSRCQIRIPTKEEIYDIYELRETLELFAINKYRENPEPEKLGELESITKQMKDLPKIKDVEERAKTAIRLDRQFHVEVCKLANNEYLNGVYRHINLHMNMTMIHEKTYNPLKLVYFQSHKAILQCLSAEDDGEEVEACVKNHFDNVKNILF